MTIKLSIVLKQILLGEQNLHEQDMLDGKHDGKISGSIWNKYNPDKPIDEKCNCRACRQHTRAYINHLFKADEILGAMLMTEHNIMYYQDLMRGIRKAIEEGRNIKC